MIQRIKDGKGVVARFGMGTVKIHPYTLKSRFGGQVELTQCVPTKIGDPPVEGSLVPDKAKIVLDFASLKSLDVLIEKLKDLREEMVDEFNL